METVSEYISKTEMLIRLKCLAPKADDWNNYDEYNAAVSQYDYMCDYLKSIEPADVAPVELVHWIQANDIDESAWRCSKCDLTWILDEGTPSQNEMRYCPKCGAYIIESECGDRERID